MVHDKRDDAALIAAHVAGDADAFTVLIRRHRDRLWAVALHTMRDPDEAADALQDALLGLPQCRGLPGRRSRDDLAARRRRQRLP